MKRFLGAIVLVLAVSIFFVSAWACDKLFEDKFDALKVDPKTESWKVIFTFGPGGENEVPYLKQYINDKDRLVRFNSVMMLGKYFLTYDLKDQLKALYWRENDSDVKLIILSSLEGLITNVDESKQFFSSVIQREQDQAAKKYAQESLGFVTQLKTLTDTALAQKEIDPKKFRQEYDLLYKNYGKKGDYKKLMSYSCFENEGDLRRLRMRILERCSDEALYDYQDVTSIIAVNRYLKDANN